MTDIPDPEALTSIRNIGPALAEDLIRAGVPTVSKLREIGADDAYRRLLISGTRPHFIGYYVLHMALQGRPWNDCKGAEKAALRAKFDALKAQTSGARNDTGMERLFDELGIGKRR